MVHSLVGDSVLQRWNSFKLQDLILKHSEAIGYLHNLNKPLDQSFLILTSHLDIFKGLKFSQVTRIFLSSDIIF